MALAYGHLDSIQQPFCGLKISCDISESESPFTTSIQNIPILKKIGGGPFNARQALSPPTANGKQNIHTSSVSKK